MLSNLASKLRDDLEYTKDKVENVFQDVIDMKNDIVDALKPKNNRLNLREVLQGLKGNLKGGLNESAFNPRLVTAVVRNAYFARDKNDVLVLRFDDIGMDPEYLPDEKVVSNQLNIPIHLLGSAVRMREILGQVELLLQNGKAYVDKTPLDEEGSESKWHDSSVDENEKAWKQMQGFDKEVREWTVRAKIDPASSNPFMRDPVLMKCGVMLGFINKVYPTFDFACAVFDANDGVTRVLRHASFKSRNEQYLWLMEAMNVSKPIISDFGTEMEVLLEDMEAGLLPQDNNQSQPRLKSTPTASASASASDSSVFVNDEYQYAKYEAPFSETMPVMCDGLPWEESQKVSLGAAIAMNRVSTWWALSKRSFTMSSPDDFKGMLWRDSYFPSAYMLEKIWKNDWAFARQFISGVNPVLIRVCDTNKNALPVALRDVLQRDADAMRRINAVLAGQGTLMTLTKEKRIFFIDYEDVDAVDPFTGRVVYAPIVVFYLRHDQGERTLLPLAIYLRSKNQTGVKIYTPPNLKSSDDLYNTEEGRVWLLARMHAVNADANYHEMVCHLGQTHLALEPFIVALNRHLPSDHAVLKLVKPHLFGTININDLGRNTLLKTEGSIFDDITSVGRNGGLALIANNYREKWSMATAAFPHKMKAHGFEEVKNPGSDEDILPGYFYRDDGYKLWQALTTYITTSINDIYKNDADVVNDSQLQQVWRDFKQKDAANVAGDIPAWNSKQALIDFLVLAIFIGSAEHSAVNFGQLDFYAFIPNRYDCRVDV